MSERKKIVIFASGKGTNAEVLILKMRENVILADPILIITDRPAPVEVLGVKHNIQVFRIERKSYLNRSEWDLALIKKLSLYSIDYILLCGYLQLIPKEVCKMFPDKIINIHPAPLPEFGGKGMYGLHLHQSVIDAKVQWSGPTIHFVNEEYDKGDIIDHVPVPVFPDDTPQKLAERVLKMEHLIYPVVVAKLFNSVR